MPPVFIVPLLDILAGKVTLNKADERFNTLFVGGVNINILTLGNPHEISI